MTTKEATTIRAIEITQATMREKQHNMQQDINELKRLVKETNDQIAVLNQKFDELSGAKRILIWLTGVVISLAALIVAWINGHKS